MKKPKNKIFELLSSLTPKELMEFEKYIVSESGKKNQLHKVFLYIKSYYPKFESEELKIKKVVSKISDIETKSMGNLYSRLYGFLVDFLIWKKLKKDSVEKDALLLKIFRERGTSKLLEKQIRNAHIRLENEKAQKGLDHFYFYKKMELHHYNYFDANDEQAILKLENPDIKQITEFLESFYSASTLKYYCELLQRRNILQETLINEEDIVRVLNLDVRSNSIFHQVYHKLLLKTNQCNSQEFGNLKDWLIENISSLSIDNQQMVVSHLINIASQKIKQGDKSFIDEAFQLYKHAYENSLLDKNISSVTFNNIINLAVYLNEFEWANEFKDSKFYFIQEEKQSNIKLLSIAQEEFSKTNFEEAQRVLSKVKFNSSYYKIRGRTLFIRSIYESKMDKSFILSDCKSFTQQLNRMNGIHKKMILSYTNFIKIIRNLLSNRLSNKVIEEKINDIEYLQFKHWLLQKLEERKN